MYIQVHEMIELFGCEYPQLETDEKGIVYLKSKRQGDFKCDLPKDVVLFKYVLLFIKNFIRYAEKDNPWFILRIERPALAHIVRETYKRQGVPCGPTKARNMSRLLNIIFWYFRIEFDKLWEEHMVNAQKLVRFQEFYGKAIEKQEIICGRSLTLEEKESLAKEIQKRLEI